MGKGMWRKVIAVLLGAFVANVVFFLVSMVADYLYPTPPELMNPQTPEATAQRVETAERNGLLLVLLGSALGGFVGGMIGAGVAKDRKMIVASAIGALLSLWAFYSFYVFYPARLWFPAGMLLCFLLLPGLGSLLVGSLKGRGLRQQT